MGEYSQVNAIHDFPFSQNQGVQPSRPYHSGWLGVGVTVKFQVWPRERGHMHFGHCHQYHRCGLTLRQAQSWYHLASSKVSVWLRQRDELLVHTVQKVTKAKVSGVDMCERWRWTSHLLWITDGKFWDRPGNNQNHGSPTHPEVCPPLSVFDFQPFALDPDAMLCGFKFKSVNNPTRQVAHP